MLVLSRKRNEQIVIADKIVVTIVDIRGDKVRIGIEAPAEVPVHRREVYEALHRQQGLASTENLASTEGLASTESLASTPATGVEGS